MSKLTLPSPSLTLSSIETGKTHEEAKMKIVLLTCELERVNTFNYSLVRENEVLRVQANKSEREKDLETKLAIVLAENEKLNQVIEEVYEVYMSQRGYGSNEEYERRIAELYEDLNDWKQRYNVLETQGNVVQLQNAVNELQSQRELLTEQLSRKDRDLEAMRAHLASLDHEGDQSREVAQLMAENEALRGDLETLKLRLVRADGLQSKLSDYESKVRLILTENENLNDLLTNKVEEVKDLRSKLEEANAQRSHESTISSHNVHKGEQLKKAAAVPRDNELNNKLQDLSKENDELRRQLEYLKVQVGNAHEFEDRLRIIMEENERLISLIHEKDRELGALRDTSNSSRESQAAVERLTDKIRLAPH